MSQTEKQGRHLLSLAALSGVATLVRLGAGVAVTKVLAVSLGAAGLGMYAQAQNLMSMLTGLAVTGLSNGVTRTVAADADGGPAGLKRVVGSAFLGAALFALLASVVLLIAAEPLAAWLFDDGQKAALVRWVAAALPFACCAPVPLAALNGQHESLRCVLAPMIVNVLGAAACMALATTQGLPGATLSIVVTQAMGLAVNGAFFARRNRGWALADWLRADVGTVGQLSKFALMALIGGLASQAALLYVRTTVATQLGWQAAGHWQAVIKISEIYLSPLTTALTIYYMPRLARTETAVQFQRLLRAAFVIIVPGTALGGLLVYALRHQIVHLALSPEFAPVADVIWLQLVADCLKLTSFLFAMVMWAKGMTRSYLVLEVACSVLFAVLAGWLVQRHGVEGALMANLLMYLVYLVASLVVAVWLAPWQKRITP